MMEDANGRGIQVAAREIDRGPVLLSLSCLSLPMDRPSGSFARA